MSKILYACFREGKPKEFSNEAINSLSKRLQPDNITFPRPKILEGEKEILAIFNPSELIEIHEKSLCHGVLMNPPLDWWQPLSQIPDGSYALYRCTDSTLEIVSDIVASKSVWYYFDENIFISSSSQRAIIFFLGSFIFNTSVIPWMLSTGGIGPGQSWDKRIKLIPGNSSLILNRDAWELMLNEAECLFEANNESVVDQKNELLKILKDTIGTLDLDYSKWVLPLSGGYDSRGILYLLKSIKGLKSITWGDKSAQKEKKNDAYVAKLVAKEMRIENDYMLTDVSNEPIAEIFNRFLICSEGRVDGIVAYLDGLKIWKDLYENGISGIIRGDEAFGYLIALSEQDVLMRMGIPKFSDYSNLTKIQDFGIEELEYPEWMSKKGDESKETFFDRLYQLYRLPHYIAALNEIKLTYVEVITPLLTKQTVDFIRQLPDKLRENKILFKKIVNSIGPRLPYARYDSVKTPENIHKRKDVILEVISELKSENVNHFLPKEFIDFLLNKLIIRESNVANAGNPLYKVIKSYLPSRIKRILRYTILKKELDLNLLAFRAYIISKMNTMLIEDSKAIK